MDKLFIKAINDAFAAAAADFVNAGLPPVATIDKFRGQPLNPEAFEIFALPAVFYNMKCDWSKSGKSYNGIMTVEFHIVQDATWEISNISTNMEEGLKQVDLLNLVRRVLDGVSSPNTGKLTRLTEIPVDSGVTIYDMIAYTGSFTDPAVVNNQNLVEVTPEMGLEGQLVKRL